MMATNREEPWRAFMSALYALCRDRMYTVVCLDANVAERHRAYRSLLFTDGLFWLAPDQATINNLASELGVKAEMASGFAVLDFYADLGKDRKKNKTIFGVFGCFHPIVFSPLRAVRVKMSRNSTWFSYESHFVGFGAWNG